MLERAFIYCEWNEFCVKEIPDLKYKLPGNLNIEYEY